MIEILNENITFDKLRDIPSEIDKLLEDVIASGSHIELLDALEIIKEARIKSIQALTDEINELNTTLKKITQEVNYIEKHQKKLVPEGTTVISNQYKFTWTSSKSVEILDINKIPIDLKTSKTTTNADKNAIKKAIENNQDIPGATIATNWHFKTSLK
ncbi:MAG: siphovirus Gp157 family protein [Sphaerochaeta sp.]|jgi:FtsZ-binding cell division protein ZapB